MHNHLYDVVNSGSGAQAQSQSYHFFLLFSLKSQTPSLVYFRVCDIHSALLFLSVSLLWATLHFVDTLLCLKSVNTGN